MEVKREPLPADFRVRQLRARDMLRYYGDSEVQDFAYRKDLALLLPFHCRAKTYEDMDVDPSKGIGRALFAALDQLAKPSGRPELASAKLIFRKYFEQGAPWAFVIQNKIPHWGATWWPKKAGPWLWALGHTRAASLPFRKYRESTRIGFAALTKPHRESRRAQ